MTHLDFPFHVDRLRRTATTDHDEHVRDLLEQLLLTGPGERVNRPELGSGLLAMPFEPTSPEVAAAVELTVQAGIQQWLRDVVDVHALEVTSEDTTLRVSITYEVIPTGQRRTDVFERPVAP